MYKNMFFYLLPLLRRIASGEGIVTVGVTLSRSVCVSVHRAATARVSH